MKFKKEDLQEILDLEPNEVFEDFPFVLITTFDTYKSRWEQHKKLIFRYEDKLYCAPYSHGLSESQDVMPFEYDPDEIECEEVVAQEQVITKTVYVKKEHVTS